MQGSEHHVVIGDSTTQKQRWMPSVRLHSFSATTGNVIAGLFTRTFPFPRYI